METQRDCVELPQGAHSVLDTAHGAHIRFYRYGHKTITDARARCRPTDTSRAQMPTSSRQRGVGLLAYYLWFHQARPTFAKWPGSQGDQEDVLQDLFYGLIGTANRFCVEFGGCPGVPGSNTVRLRSNNTVPLRVLPRYREIHTQWSGLLLEGSPNCRPKNFDLRPGTQFHTAWIGSDTIVDLFDKYGVPAEVDYVSIDLDSVDLWVLRALLTPPSKYRPRVFTIEYNGNFGSDDALTMPDPTTMPVAPFNVTDEHMVHARKPNAYQAALCYQGATARAIELVAQEFGYVIVNKTLGLDLFLVRKDLWHWRVPKLEELHVNKCMNAPMTPDMAVNLLDFQTYRRHESASLSERLCEANRAAAAKLNQLARTGSCRERCFKHLREPLPESPACRQVRLGRS